MKTMPSDIRETSARVQLMNPDDPGSLSCFPIFRLIRTIGSFTLTASASHSSFHEFAGRQHFTFHPHFPFQMGLEEVDECLSDVGGGFVSELTPMAITPYITPLAIATRQMIIAFLALLNVSGGAILSVDPNDIQIHPPTTTAVRHNFTSQQYSDTA